jgi:DNA mismatch endonuclease (patch repair protein)
MADVHSKEIRSKNMAAIKSKNTKPEMLVRRFLHANGYRYKLNDKSPRQTWQALYRSLLSY